MKTNLVLIGIAAAPFVIAACATSPNPPPRHPSAAQYDELAAGEVVVERCGGVKGSVSGYEQTCWTEYANPTRYHLDEAA